MDTLDYRLHYIHEHIVALLFPVVGVITATPFLSVKFRSTLRIDL